MCGHKSNVMMTSCYLANCYFNNHNLIIIVHNWQKQEFTTPVSCAAISNGVSFASALCMSIGRFLEVQTEQECRLSAPRCPSGYPWRWSCFLVALGVTLGLLLQEHWQCTLCLPWLRIAEAIRETFSFPSYKRDRSIQIIVWSQHLALSRTHI